MARKKVKYFTFGPYLYDTPNNAFEVFDNTSGAIQLTVEHDGIACSAWTANKLLMAGPTNGEPIPKAKTGNLADIVTSSDSSITISANDIIVAQSGIAKAVFDTSAIADGSEVDFTTFTFAGNHPAEIGRALVIAHHWTGSALDGTIDGWIEFFYSVNSQATGPSITKIAADTDSDVRVGNGTGLSNNGIRVYNYSSGNQLRLDNETGSIVKYRIVWWNLT